MRFIEKLSKKENKGGDERIWVEGRRLRRTNEGGCKRVIGFGINQMYKMTKKDMKILKRRRFHGS